eukprot:gene17962-21435_t
MSQQQPQEKTQEQVDKKQPPQRPPQPPQQTSQCQNLLSKYFYGNVVSVKMVTINSNGTTVYAVGQLDRSSPTILKNINSYVNSIVSTSESCVQGKTQIFDVQQSSDIFTTGQLSISNRGQVITKSLPPFDLTFCQEGVFTGIGNNKMYVFYLSNNKINSIGGSCDSSVQPPKNNNIEITVQFGNSWTEGSIQYTHYNALIKNTASNTRVTSCTISSSMKLKDASTMYNLNTVSSGQYALPSTQSLASQQTYPFNFITSDTTKPHFKVVQVTRV